MVSVNKSVELSRSNYQSQQIKSKELNRIISERKIKIVYQPIVDLRTAGIIGYESLTRGPEGSLLFSPIELFQAAVDNRMLSVLEQICREEAIYNIHHLGPEQQLFININADVVNDPHFQNGQTKKCVIKRGLNPEQVTFEITERTAINDFDSFCRSLYHYRRQGYCIAVDDAGAGYSSLQSIAELSPEYIKLDMSIIRGIHLNPLKQAIVEAMVKLGAAVNAKIIAEGVEAREELIELHNLGIHLVQGYYLAKPAFPAPEIRLEAVKLIRNLNNNVRNSTSHKMLTGSGVSIGEIVEAATVIGKDIFIGDVKRIIDERNLSGVVVAENNIPIGLVMKDKLHYHLSSRYGVALYQKRPIALVMDKMPLIVRADMLIEDVSQIAMSRHDRNLYDFVIVVEGGNYLGVVSIMSLLNNITKMQISRAHSANPLTGLPGNLMIEAKLKELVQNQHSFVVFYVDLDNFKAFNDKYGFEKGDQAILLTTNVICKSLTDLGCSDYFLGHIGGDDFILILKPGISRLLAKQIIDNFNKEIRELYNRDDLSKGYIEVYNRRGYLEDFPIMSISIAAITSAGRKFDNYLKIGEIAAELKKAAKRNKGSSVVFDRTQQTVVSIDV